MLASFWTYISELQNQKKVCLHFDHVGATLSFASDCSEHW